MSRNSATAGMAASGRTSHSGLRRSIANSRSRFTADFPMPRAGVLMMRNSETSSHGLARTLK